MCLSNKIAPSWPGHSAGNCNLTLAAAATTTTNAQCIDLSFEQQTGPWPCLRQHRDVTVDLMCGLSLNFDTGEKQPPCSDEQNQSSAL